MNAPQPRPLPTWGWVLAVLFFPSGLFVAFGSARLLSWPKAIAGALISYGCVVGLVRLMVYAERVGGEFWSGLILFGGVLVFWFWGGLLHEIGKRAKYWSPTAQRAWMCAFWFAVAALGLIAIGMVLWFNARIPFG